MSNFVKGFSTSSNTRVLCIFQIFMKSKKMSTDASSTRNDHLAVTSGQDRQQDSHDVTVTQINNLSRTVKHLVLKTRCRPVPFSFKPGQWIDMFIPGLKQVGGFSITSSPTHLKKTGEFHLAIKYSESPPSKWVHTLCKEGSKVKIRIGGNFFLDIKNLESKRILLIAGGVGINPLASMIADLKDANFKTDSSHKLKTCLLFSAKTYDELIFLKELNSIEDSEFTPLYFLTTKALNEPLPNAINVGRITCEKVGQTIEKILGIPINSQLKDKLSVYLCGPVEMITSMTECLKTLGVTEIFSENWWEPVE